MVKGRVVRTLICVVGITGGLTACSTKDNVGPVVRADAPTQETGAPTALALDPGGDAPAVTSASSIAPATTPPPTEPTTSLVPPSLVPPSLIPPSLVPTSTVDPVAQSVPGTAKDTQPPTTAVTRAPAPPASAARPETTTSTQVPATTLLETFSDPRPKSSSALAEQIRAQAKVLLAKRSLRFTYSAMGGCVPTTITSDIDRSVDPVQIRRIFKVSRSRPVEDRHINGLQYIEANSFEGCVVTVETPKRWFRLKDFNFDQMYEVRMISALESLVSGDITVTKSKTARFEVSWTSPDESSSDQISVWLTNGAISEMSYDGWDATVRDIPDVHLEVPKSFDDFDPEAQSDNSLDSMTDADSTAPQAPVTYPPLPTLPPTTAPYRTPRIAPQLPKPLTKQLPALKPGNVIFKITMSPNTQFLVFDNGVVVGSNATPGATSDPQNYVTWRASESAMKAMNSTIEKAAPSRAGNVNGFADDGSVTDQQGSTLAFGAAKTADAHRAILEQLVRDLSSEIVDEPRQWFPSTMVLRLTSLTPAQVANRPEILKWPLKRPITMLLEYGTKSSQSQYANEPISCVFVRADEVPDIWALRSNSPYVIVTDQGKNYDLRMYFSLEPNGPPLGC
jgi:hypothetical protein